MSKLFLVSDETHIYTHPHPFPLTRVLQMKKYDFVLALGKQFALALFAVPNTPMNVMSIWLTLIYSCFISDVRSA